MNISIQTNYNGSYTLFAIVEGKLVTKEYSCGIGEAKKHFQETFGK
jgi:hypothetical protein